MGKSIANWANAPLILGMPMLGTTHLELVLWGYCDAQQADPVARLDSVCEAGW